MIKTKISCDAVGGYLHSYKTDEDLIEEVISQRWWQIECHPGTVVISQPVSREQFKSDANHACSAECAKRIIEKWSKENIKEVPEEKDASDIPY